MQFSSDLTRRWRGLAVAMLGLVPLLAPADPGTLCHGDETPYFSCLVGKKTVSLCGAESAGAIARLTYRYGRPEKVELEFSATSAGGPHFLATTEPAAPRAEIMQVWFDKGSFSYLMHVCQGGDCPYGAGLAVLRGGHVQSNAKCRRGDDAMDYFSRELVEFGDGNAHSRSHTPLLEVGDYGNPIDELYPMPAAVFH